MSESSSSREVDFFNLCKDNVRSIEDILASCEDLLNKRQCQDLSSKLSQTAHNVGELLDSCGASVDLFRPALEDLYRYLEKAKLLVRNCAEEDWCAAAVFQCQNENAFQEIVLEVGLCYNAIYELAKSQSQVWNIHPEDLRQSSLFLPSKDSDVDQDKQDLQKRLDELANGHTNCKRMDYFIPGRVARKQCLARYLLLKMYCSSKEPQASTLDTYSAILWTKVSEPSGTWGSPRFLGAGSGASGVCSTEWLGIPCAKKEFHGEASETSFSKEAGILAHLKHPRIVNFICCGNGHERGDRFIAMELMEKSLLDLIEEQKGERFSVPVAVDMMVQIARGVSYLHSQGVAHRDLKPGNVVVNRLTSLHLTHRFCLKLVDFGISKTKVDVLKASTMTYRGIGTTMYRAPEAHPKANPNGIGKVKWFKADAFSFAMTCAHLLYLKAPLKDKNPTELYNEVTWYAQRSEVCDLYPQDLIVLLEDCWKIKPQSRPSFMEICTRLEIFHHKFLMGHSTSNQCSKEDKVDFDPGLDFIKMKFDSSIKSPIVDKAEDLAFDDVVSAISCTCRRALEILPQPPYSGDDFICNICSETGDGEVYHCETCNFDAHPACAEIKDNVKAAFHDHTLHLLVQNYHNDNPDAICYFCEESVQDSEWVYRCEQCDFDLHALCTKFPMKRMCVGVHLHLLTLSQCPPRKTLVCSCCNGKVKEYTWRYTYQLQSCVFDLHPLCSIAYRQPLCIFDSSHRLRLVTVKISFHCSRCGAPGFSWFYNCDHCGVELHTDCVDDMDEERFDWNGTHEKFMIEYGTKDNHTKINLISELLEKVPGSDALESNSSARSRQPLGTTRAQVSIERLALTENSSFDDSMDVSLQRMIGVTTEERIEARKMAAKEARKKLRANSLEMLENLEKIVVDLRSSENMSQDHAVILAATHQKLKRRHDLVKEQIAMQAQSKMCQGPRMAVFYQTRKEGEMVIRVLLTRIRADMIGVRFTLFCEEPGDEHLFCGRRFIDELREEYIEELQGECIEELGEEDIEKLQPLLACGLQVVMRAMSTLEPHELTGLESITLPCLGAEPWDLRAIEMDGNRSLLFEGYDEMEALKRAADSAAEWFRSELENCGMSVLKDYGLQRVRYKVTEERDSPRFRRGTLAWVCTDRLNSGLIDGTLESYPLKYFNVEDDHLLRCPSMTP